MELVYQYTQIFECTIEFANAMPLTSSNKIMRKEGKEKHLLKSNQKKD